MSCMLCNRCERLVDTDEDLDSLYVTDGQCVCEHCRTDEDLGAVEANTAPVPITRETFTQFVARMEATAEEPT
jgi:hypothetical protein